MARVVLFANPLPPTFFEKFFSDVLGLGHFWSSHRCTKIVTVFWCKNGISSTTTLLSSTKWWVKRCYFYVNIVVVQQIPFLCQNMVTIFVHFDDLTENDLTPENLKNNVSKKVDAVDLERKLP